MIQLQRNPNDWSCLPTSFAMALGVPVEKVILDIGHDGSATPYHKSRELKLGFHEQECIEVAVGMGFACTPIELYPCITPDLSGSELQVIYFKHLTCQIPSGVPDYIEPGCYEKLVNWTRFWTALTHCSGVITGVCQRPNLEVIGHAVAWDHTFRKVVDPKGTTYTLQESKNFLPRCFWKLQKVR